MKISGIKKIYKKILSLVVFVTVFLPIPTAAAVFPSMDEIKMGIGNAIMSMFAALLGVAGKLLDYSMEYTLKMSTLVQSVGVVEVGWKLFRDLANMAFIFVLLYIAIATILGVGNYKKILVHVVIAALLINFSLFATNIVIDASNIIANEFYQSMANVSGGVDIAGQISSNLNLNTIYKTDEIKGTAEATGLGEKNIFTITIMGSIFMMITAFTFFAASVMLIVRVAVLMMLMVLSPLAFLSFVLPGLKAQVFDKWWSELISQSFFAPIFMALMYVVVAGTSSEKFRLSLSGASDNSFAAAFTGGDQMIIILNFILVIALVIAALNIAKSMSGKAGAAAMKWGGVNASIGAARFARTQTVGRAMSRVADSKAMKALGTRAPGVGRMMTAGLDKMGGASYDKYAKKQEKSKVAYGSRVSKRSRGEEREMREIQALPEYNEKQLKKLVRLEGIEKTRKDMVAKSYEKPGIISRVLGQDISDRNAAKRIKKNETGEDPRVEAYKNFLANEDKKGNENTSDKTKKDGDSNTTK